MGIFKAMIAGQRNLAAIALELVEVNGRLNRLLKQGERTMKELDDLTREVEETGSAVASLITLTTGLGELIRDNVDNRAKLLDLAAKLETQQQLIAQAVLANQVPVTQPPPPSDPPVNNNEV